MMGTEVVCLRCGKKFVYLKQGHTHEYCAGCYQRERGFRRKIKLIEMAGGCCVKCGYSRNLAALSFHHRDPAGKEHRLDIRRLSGCSWSKIVIEFKKCDLLCHNCHLEEHHPHLTMDKVRSQVSLGDTELRVRVPYCVDCGVVLSEGGADRCTACWSKAQERIEWPPTSVLLEVVGSFGSWEAAAKQLGVSSNAIRKRIKNHPV